jgi:protein-tyrosine sulfotransferase
VIDRNGVGLAFVLSTPRAGSGLLGAILGTHDRVLCPPEPWILLLLASLRDPRLVASTAFDYRVGQMALRELLAEEQFRDAVAAFACAAYNGLLASAGKDVFVDRTPRYYQIAAQIDELFPAAKKVWLVRNPLDVVASCKEASPISIEELLGGPPNPYTFDLTVGFKVLRDHLGAPGNQALVLHYEELVREPAARVAAVCELLGVQFDEAMVEDGANAALIDEYLHTSIGRWHDVLTPPEVVGVLRALGPETFERLGYAEDYAEAIEYFGLTEVDIPPDGRLPELCDAFDRYPSVLDGAGHAPYTLVQEELLRQRKLVDEKETAITSLAFLAEARLQSIEEKQAEINSLASVVKNRARLIETLDAERRTIQRAAEERLEIIKRLERDLLAAQSESERLAPPEGGSEPE